MNEAVIRELHGNLQKLDNSFTRTPEEFMQDISNEDIRKQLWKSLSEIDPKFTRTYDEFSSDLGLPVASQQAIVAQAQQQADAAKANKTNKTGVEENEIIRPQDYKGADSFYNISDDELRSQIEALNSAREAKKESVRKKQAERQKSFFYRLGSIMNDANTGFNASDERDRMEVEMTQLDPKSEERYNRLIQEQTYRQHLAGGEYEKLGKELEEAYATLNAARIREGKSLDTGGAEAFLDKAMDLYKAPSKFGNSNGFVNWWEGVADQATDYDTYTAGVTEMFRMGNLLSAVNKMEKGEKLTDSEEAEMEAFLLYTTIQDARQNDLSMGYTIGKGTMESIPFMIEMLGLSAGGAAIKEGMVRLLLKKGKTAAANKLARAFGDKIISKAVKDKTGKIIQNIALEEVEKGMTEKVARQIGEDVLMTAFMPTTWAQVSEDAVDEKLSGDGDYSFQDFLRTFAGATIETGTEHWGGKLVDKAIGKVMPLDKIWGKTRWGKLLSNDFIQSPFGETGEEYVGAITNYLRSYDPIENWDFEKGEWKKESEELRQEARQMFSVDGFAQTFLTVLPMSIGGGVINVAVAKKNLKSYQNTKKELTNMLVGYGATNEQAANVVMQIEGAEDSKQFAERLSITERQLLNEFKKAHPEATVSDLVKEKEKIDKMLGKYMKSAAYLNEMNGEIKAAYDALDDDKKQQVAKDFSKLIAARVEAADKRIKEKKEAKEAPKEEPKKGEKKGEKKEESKKVEPEGPVSTKREIEIRIDGSPVKILLMGKANFNEDGSIDFDAIKHFWLRYADGSNGGVKIPDGQIEAVRNAVNDYLKQEKAGNNGQPVVKETRDVESEIQHDTSMPLEDQLNQLQEQHQAAVDKEDYALAEALEKRMSQVNQQIEDSMTEEEKAARAAEAEHAAKLKYIEEVYQSVADQVAQKGVDILEKLTPEQKFIWTMKEDGLKTALEDAEGYLKDAESTKDRTARRAKVKQWQEIIDKYKDFEKKPAKNLVEPEKSSTFAVNITQNAGEDNAENRSSYPLNETDRVRYKAALEKLRDETLSDDERAAEEEIIRSIQDKRKAQMLAVVEEAFSGIDGITVSGISEGAGVYIENGEVIEYTSEVQLNVEEGKEDIATSIMAVVAEKLAQNSYIMTNEDDSFKTADELKKAQENGDDRFYAGYADAIFEKELTPTQVAIITKAFIDKGLGCTIVGNKIVSFKFDDDLSDSDFYNFFLQTLGIDYGNAKTTLSSDKRNSTGAERTGEQSSFGTVTSRRSGFLTNDFVQAKHEDVDGKTIYLDKDGNRTTTERYYGEQYHSRTESGEENKEDDIPIQGTSITPADLKNRIQTKLDETEAAMSAPASPITNEGEGEGKREEEYINLKDDPDIVLMYNGNQGPEKRYVFCRKTEDGKLINVKTGRELKTTRGGKETAWRQIDKRVVKMDGKEYIIHSIVDADKLKYYNDKGGKITVTPIDGGAKIDVPIADLTWEDGSKVFLPSEERDYYKHIADKKWLEKHATSIDQILDYPLYKGNDSEGKPIKFTLRDLIEAGYSVMYLSQRGKALTEEEYREREKKGEKVSIRREWTGKDLLKKVVERIKQQAGGHADETIINGDINIFYNEAIEIWNAFVKREKLNERLEKNTSDFVKDLRNSVLTDGKVDLSLPKPNGIEDYNRTKDNPLEKIRDAKRAIEKLLEAEDKQGGKTKVEEEEPKKPKTPKQIADEDALDELSTLQYELRHVHPGDQDEKERLEKAIADWHEKYAEDATELHAGEETLGSRLRRESGERVVGVLQKAGIEAEIIDEEDLPSIMTDKELKKLKTKGGVVYALKKGKKMWIVRQRMNPNSPIHEYGHIWVDIVRNEDAKLWEGIKKLLKGTKMWQEVLNDDKYEDIHDDEEMMSSEVFSRLLGARFGEFVDMSGKTRFDEMIEKAETNKLKSLYISLRKAIDKFVITLLGKFNIKIGGQKKFMSLVDRVLHMPLEDLVKWSKALEELNSDEMRDAFEAMSVYHGTTADFDHFDHTFMGSGEGAQAFGWGSYVSSVRGVGISYAEQDAKRKSVLRGMYIGENTLGRKMYYNVRFGKYEISDAKSLYNFLMWNLDFDFKIDEHTCDYILSEIKDGIELGRRNRFTRTFQECILEVLDRQIQTLQWWAKRYDTTTEEENQLVALTEVRDWLDKNQKDVKVEKSNSGEPVRRLLTVEIPDDTGDNYLAWNKKLTERQIDIISNVIEELRLPADELAEVDGGTLYRIMVDDIESLRRRSLRFNDGVFVHYMSEESNRRDIAQNVASLLRVQAEEDGVELNYNDAVYVLENEFEAMQDNIEFSGKGIEEIIYDLIGTLKEEIEANNVSHPDIYTRFYDWLVENKKNFTQNMPEQFKGINRADEIASKYLNSLGFTGIKVPVNYHHSGGKDNDALNYVIFNDQDLDITDKIEFDLGTGMSERNNGSYSSRYSLAGDLISEGYLIHGTPEEFDKFDKDKIKGGSRMHEGYGFYFSDMPYKGIDYGKNIKLIKKDDFNFIDSRKTKVNEDSLFLGEYERLLSRIGRAKEQQSWVRNNREFDEFSKQIEEAEKELENYDTELIDYVKAAIRDLGEYNTLRDVELHIPEVYRPRLAAQLQRLGYDGYLNDGVYVVFNFDKLNQKVQSIEQVEEELFGTSTSAETLTAEEQSIKEKAIEDGTFMKSPKGTPTNLTEKQWLQVRTERFKEWFGDWLNDPENASKVLDENGEPLVVYRGSKNANSTVFRSAGSVGYWFSPNREVAKQYVSRTAGKDEEIANMSEDEINARIQPCFLNIRNMSTLDTEGRAWNNLYGKTMYQVWDEDGGFQVFDTEEEASDFAQSLGLDPDDYYPWKGSTDEVFSQRKAEGADGMLFTNIVDGGDIQSSVYVVAQNTQAKSATHNRGTFDKTNPDIEYQIGDADMLENMAEPREVAEKMSWFQKKVNAVLDQANGLRLLLKKIGEIEGQKVPANEDVRDALEAKQSKIANTLNLFGYHQRRHLKKALRAVQKSMKKTGLWKKGMKDYYQNKSGAYSERELTTINVLDMYLQAKDTLERLQQGKKVRDIELSFRLLQYLGLPANTELKKQEQRNAVLQKMVDKFESTLSKEEISNLWASINECTRFILDKMHEGKLIGDNVYEELKKSQFYVPERGFAQLESDEDVRNSISFNRSKKKGISPDAMKKAKGGESMATDVIANILHLATNAVACAEENKVRLAAFNLMKNHEDACNQLGYPKAERVWYVRNGFNEDGTPRYEAQIEKPSADIIAANDKVLREIKEYRDDLKLFEGDKDMQETIKKKIDEEKQKLLIVQKKDANGASISRATLAGEEMPKVLVSVPTEDGDVQQYTMTFPNQPEIANALNGVLDTKFSDSWLKTVGRFFSSMFTTYNPLFWSRNLPRDVLFVLQKGTAERGIGYGAYFTAEMMNPLTYTPIIEYVMGLDVEDRKEGKAFSKDGIMERDFQKFLEGGGNTGFTQMKEIQAFRKEADRLVNGENPIGATLGFIFKEVPAALNEFSELWTRFAVYKATKQSLQMENRVIKTLGRGLGDIKRTTPYSEEEIEAMALHDSRNFSTNFNRRGAGGFADFFNSISMFANAAIQGAMGTYRTFEQGEWPKGIRGAMSLMIIPAFLGYILTLLTPDDDDDEKKIPDFIRQNNLVFLDKRIPLSYELVPWYRIGVNYALMEQNRLSKTDGIENIAMGFAEHALPVPPSISNSLKTTVDMSISETDFSAKNPNLWQAVLPLIYGEFANPFMELSHGKNWTGSNLRYEYAKDKPQWMFQDYEAELYKDISKALYKYVGDGDMDKPSITVNGKKMNDFENMSPKEVKNIIGSITPNGWLKIACYGWGLIKDNVREQDIPLKSDFNIAQDADMSRIGISAEMTAMVREAKENYTRIPSLRDMDEKEANRIIKDWGALSKDYTELRLEGDSFSDRKLKSYKTRLEHKYKIKIDGNSKEDIMHAYIIVMTNEEINAKGLDRTIGDMERWMNKYKNTPTYGFKR